MSADSSWDVQTGVYTLLTGTTGVTDLLADGANSILDHVPPGTMPPYIVASEIRVRPLDTQGASGNEMVLTLHTYSRNSGMQEVRGIMAAVHDALHNASFSIPGQTLVLCQCIDSEARLEGDGLTRHGIQHFQIITEE